MQFNANEHTIIKTHLKVSKVVDGDGLIVVDLFGNNAEEIRLLGIDAPETTNTRKLRQDERETHLPAEFLISLGLQSKSYLNSILSFGTSVTLVMEKKHPYDSYGRTLAYVFLNDGSCVNELMISSGFAKAYSKYYCNNLSEFQVKNFEAKREKRGLYSAINSF